MQLPVWCDPLGPDLYCLLLVGFLTVLLIRISQYDAFDIGFITTDDFTNADILEATYPALAKRFYDDRVADPAIPVVTGFLGKVHPALLEFTFLSSLLFICCYVVLMHISIDRLASLVLSQHWAGVAAI